MISYFDNDKCDNVNVLSQLTNKFINCIKTTVSYPFNQIHLSYFNILYTILTSLHHQSHKRYHPLFMYFHSQSHTSIQDLNSTTNFSSTQLTHKSIPKNHQQLPYTQKQLPHTQKYITASTLQSTTKSVTKFKRTNPAINQSKPNSQINHHIKPSPYLHKNNHVDQNIKKQHYLDNFQNQNFNQPIPKLNITSSLTTSRQSAQTNQYHTNDNFNKSNETQIYFTDRKHMTFFTDRNSTTLEKYPHKNQDIISLKSFKSGKSSKKGLKPDHQNYTLYWKKKAHQYLENNFKLSQEIQKLKKKLSKYQNNHPHQEEVQKLQENQKNQANLQKKVEQRSIPLHIVQLQQRKYIHEIDQFLISNKIKDSMIENLQNKIIELNQQIRGEKQKSELMQKMRQQIHQLQIKNNQLTKELKNESLQKRKYQKIHVLQQTKQQKQSSNQQINLQFGDYKFEKDLQRLRHHTHYQ